MLERSLLWTPRAKGRPQTTFTQGKVRTYTPKATVAAEKALADQWDDDPIEGPIEVTLILFDTQVYVEITESQPPASRKLRGDIDNYMKLVLDALNGHAWVDDRQITTLKVSKR
jgi:Holliday junction resolvase RusA-like endonuclease